MYLARRGATLHLLCRSEQRGTEAVRKIIDETGNDRVYLHVVDMSSPKSIHQFIENKCFKKNSSDKSDLHKLNILINNAGAIVEDTNLETNQTTLIRTSDGLEGNFAVNTLGPFLLTERLIPFMIDTATEEGVPSRVIVVSSGGMFTTRLDLTNLQNDKDPNNFSGSLAYAHCKRQMCCITEEWAKKYDKKLITFNSCHPGW